MFTVSLRGDDPGVILSLVPILKGKYRDGIMAWQRGWQFRENDILAI
jgi:hypothetical protein